MLFQPTNIIPSSFAGVGGDLIDATEGLTISWQVNGTSPMTGYQIVIYQNNDPSVQMFSTGVVTLSEPFYGVDGMGNVQRYSVSLTAAQLSGANIVNGYSRGYKYTIRQYWSATAYIDQTTETFFRTQKKPVVSISTTAIDGPTETLTGTYTQAQGVGLDWVRWIITADGNTVEDSGKIHTQELSYTYDGFLDDTTYAITMDYQTQSGYQGSAAKTITTSWTLLEMRAASIGVTPAEGCIGAVIDTPKIASGTLLEATGTYSITNGVLRISDTGYLEWAGDAQNAGDTFVWQGVLNDGDELNVEVGSQTGTGGKATFRITADTTNFHFRWVVNSVNVGDIEGDKTRIYNGNPVTLIVNKNRFTLVNSTGYSFSGPAYQYSFQSKTSGMYVTLTGKNSCNYLGVGNFGKILSPDVQTTIDALTGTSQPDISDQWIYLSNWGENGATTIGTTTETITSATAVLYREDRDAGMLEKVCDMAAGGRAIDYGVASGGRYGYLQVVSVATADDETAQAIYRMADPGVLLKHTADYNVSGGFLNITGSTGYLEWGDGFSPACNTLVWQGTITGGGAYITVDTATGTGGYQAFALSLQNGSLNWYWGDGENMYELGILEDPYYGEVLTLIVNGNRFILAYGTNPRNRIDNGHADITFLTKANPTSLRMSDIQTCHYLGLGNFDSLTDDEINALIANTQPEDDDRWEYLSNWGVKGTATIGAYRETFTPCFWNWVVDTGVWDDERGAYEYTGSYIFGLNVETDSFDNNNNPNLMQNFTRYPTRQGTNQNYLSGQLTGYIGHVDMEKNVYIDTAEEAEAIRALSTSTDAKFLRSRKGERWMIDTSGPIRLSLGDRYKEQPYTMSLPWVEVGDASKAPLISLPGDGAWPLD